VNTHVTVTLPLATSTTYENVTVIFMCGGTVMSSGEQSARGDGTNFGSVVIHLSGICGVTGGSTAIATTAYSTLAATIIQITTQYPAGNLGTNASAIQWVKIA
jgi:hypothetical protein